MDEKQGDKANLCQNDQNGQVRNYSSSSQLHDVLAGLQSWCAGGYLSVCEEAWSENDLSLSHLYFLTEIDQITISNYRHYDSGSPSTRDWRLPGKLCQLENNFCNQLQINLVQEDQSKNLESILCLIFSWSQGAEGKPDYDNVSDLEYLDMVISQSSL